jgi:hypothetical protein
MEYKYFCKDCHKQYKLERHYNNHLKTIKHENKIEFLRNKIIKKFEEKEDKYLDYLEAKKNKKFEYNLTQEQEDFYRCLIDNAFYARDRYMDEEEYNYFNKYCPLGKERKGLIEIYIRGSLYELRRKMWEAIHKELIEVVCHPKNYDKFEELGFFD